MRMRKLFVGLLVLVLAVGMVGMIAFAKNGNGKEKGSEDASNTVTDAVSWTIERVLQLTIDDVAFDFGAVNPGEETVTKKNANTLNIATNVDWALHYEVEGPGSDHLEVTLDATEGSSKGKGKAVSKVKVSYTLFDLSSMDPGDYSVTVTYTVTAK